MPIEDKRTLILLGNQPIITLPKGWVKFWQIEKKQPIQVIYDSILVIIPPNHPKGKELEKRVRRALFD